MLVPGVGVVKRLVESERARRFVIRLVPDAEKGGRWVAMSEPVDLTDGFIIGPTNVPVLLSLPLVHHLRA